MMTIAFRNLFLFLCCLYGSVRVSAQIETIATYGTDAGASFKATHTFGNRQWMLTAKAMYMNPVWWETDLATGATVQLDSVLGFDMNYQPVFNSAGAFFMTYSYAANGSLNRYLNFLDTNAQRHIIGPLGGNSVQPNVRQFYIHNDKLIVCIRDASGDKVYESDGTVSGTQVILQSALSVLSIAPVGNNLLISTNNGQSLRLYNYNGSGTAQLFKTIPNLPSVYSGFHRIGADDAVSYFSVYRGAGHNQVWKSDLTDAGTQLFLDSVDASSIHFDGSDFIMWLNDGHGFYVKGTVADPENTVRVPFDAALATPEVRVEYTLGSYLRILSHRNGVELGRFTANDTIRILKDLNKGPGYGAPGIISDYGYYNSQHAYTETADSTLYTVLTNGGDTQTYFYRVKDTLMSSVCPAEDPDNVLNVFLADHYLYWLRSTDTGLKLQRWDLDDAPVVQPAPSALPDTSETWFRQLAYPDKYNFYGDPFHPDYSSDLKMTADGEVVVAFYVRYLYAKFFLPSEGPAGDPLKGSVVFAKYDRYGNLMWTQSLGDLDMFMRAEPRMEVDNDGNIVLAGNFYKKGFFGTDSLQASSTGYYLAKLDGTSGGLLWYKKIASTYNVDEVKLDGMAVDNENNIYLSVLYDNFGLSMGGIQVESELNRMNAVARFSPNGSIDWLKNIPTPWTDKAGSTHFFAFDKERNRLVAAQSQGWYNWSSSCKYSDWRYFIQYLQPDGTVIDTFGFAGDDLGSLTTGFIGPDGQLTAFGYYRGDLEVGDFDASSPAGNSCQVTEGFAFRYDAGISAVTAAKKSRTQPFFALDAQMESDAYYVYGTDKHNELVLIKFAADGTEIGYKRLGQQTDPFEFGFYEYFDVENGFITLLGTDFKRDDTYGVFPVIRNGPSKSVLKIRDENWQSDTVWFGDLQLPAMQTGNEEVLVYPNPFTDDVTVVFGDAAFPYRAYGIYDMNGRKMHAGELNDLNFQQLSLGNLSAGAYFIRFTGGESAHTVRIVKVNN